MVATGHALRPLSWSPIASALGESLPTSSGAANDPPKRDGPGRDQAASGSQSEVPVMERADRSTDQPPEPAAVPAEPTPVSIMSLPARMRFSLLDPWRQARPAQRFAAIVGAALMVVGLAHLAGWLVVGGAWAGPVSLRKPTTFGMSFGLTTITLAWVAGQLRISDRTRWLLLGPLAAADAYEVAWVSVQRWRGVASHFNFGTRLDTGLFLGGGVAIAVTVTVILALTVLAFTAIRSTPSMAMAIRAGLLILLVAQGVGGWIVQHGVGPASDGATTGLTTLGSAGVMKVPHAVAIHAIQVLPALAWLLSLATLAERRRTHLVAAATFGYVALVAVSLLQTAAGVAPLDLGVVAAVLYLLGVGLLGAAFVAALLALRNPGSTATRTTGLAQIVRGSSSAEP